FESLAGTLPIDFGPASAAGPAKNQITSATGTITDQPISPGKYRVTASRGPEYTIVQKEITLAAGGKESFAGALRQVLDVSGYLGADFHQHSMLGADAPTSTIDRVISNAAEGVRIAVATEHNVVADLEPLVKEAKLDDELVEISGDEVTSDAAVIPWGHMNVFPLVRNAADPRGGAFDATKPPSTVIDSVAKITAPHVVQVNHPRAWNIGYFDLAHFDASIGAGTAPWYDGRFDALEVWNGRNVESRDKVRADYFSLLLHGHIVTPTANTDTHGVVGQEAGYPRTYVSVQNSGKVTGWDDARTNDLVHGILTTRDTVLTNGPFLRVSINGAPIGGLAKAKGGNVIAHIVVSAAPWVSVDRVGIALASGAVIEKKISLKLTKSGETSARIDIPIHVTQDDAVSIYAAGDEPLSPVLSGDAKEIAPYAMTSAIWIDADGDGKSLGRTSP
ncbi:MAG: CehA/McbA family metallohydrolase, partial [Polyangiaceae bacterium]